MSILLISPSKDFNTLKNEIERIDSNLDVQIWPAIKDKKSILFGVSWKHRHGIFEMFPNLKAVMSYGAGVDHLINDEQLNELSICRFNHDSLGDQLAEYVLTVCLNYKSNNFNYIRNRINNIWETIEPIDTDSLSVGIMGYGNIGRSVSKKLSLNGFKVYALARQGKDVNKTEVLNVYDRNEIDEFLKKSNILVNTLPLTPETDGILDLEIFKALKKPSYLINVGRGEHLVDEDLIYALDAGIIKGAALDVFNTEPLPNSHPFWSREELFITPHIAALTDPKLAAEQIVENYKRVISGLEPLNTIDRKRGY